MEFPIVCLLAIGAMVAGAGPSDRPVTPPESEVEMVKCPSVVTENRHYVANRPPLVPNPLIKLPIGSIRPQGWLRHQLECMRDGLTGRLPEISKWCDAEASAWRSPDGEGEHGWEELPYWLRGFTDLAYVLRDERLIAEARRWIDAILAHQGADGYFVVPE